MSLRVGFEVYIPTLGPVSLSLPTTDESVGMHSTTGPVPCLPES